MATANKNIATIKNGSHSLFVSVRKAHAELGCCEKSMERYKAKVNCDRSTVNKIIKIATSEFVMANLDGLPNAWSTLYEIAKYAQRRNIGEMTALMGSGALSPSKTKKEIVASLRCKVNAITTAPISATRTAVTSTYAVGASVVIQMTGLSDENLARANQLVKELKDIGCAVEAIDAPKNARQVA